MKRMSPKQRADARKEGETASHEAGESRGYEKKEDKKSKFAPFKKRGKK